MEPDDLLRPLANGPLSLMPPTALSPIASGRLCHTLDRARTAARLAQELMSTPRAERRQKARREPRFHRPELLALFNLEAESLLLAPHGHDAGEQEAEVATILAACLPRDDRGQVRRAGALAQWLLGKALLHRGDHPGAVAAIDGMVDYLGEAPEEPSEELGLANAGWAQIALVHGGVDEALACYQHAAVSFAEAGARLPAAACLAEVGFLSLGIGDLAAARRNLKRAWMLLQGERVAPATAVRVALACAECDARLARRSVQGAEPWLERARQLYALPAPPHEDVHRTWVEGCIAVEERRFADAEALLAPVQSRLLAEGSLNEVLTVTFSLLTARFASRRALQAAALAEAVERSFPRTGGPWAQALRDLAAADARGRQACDVAVSALVDRLVAHPPVPERPDLLYPRRALTDRLLRHHGEFEPVLGAAPETLE